MRPDTSPVAITLHLPPLDDAAVVEIHDFLFEILDLFEAHYGYQIHRFYQERSFSSRVQPIPINPEDDPPF